MTSHDAVLAVREAHAAAFAALEAFERVLPPPPPPRARLRVGCIRNSSGQVLVPYFVHSASEPSPLHFSSAELEDQFLGTHHDEDDVDEDVDSPQDLCDAKSESALRNVDGVYLELLRARTHKLSTPSAPLMAQRLD